MEPNGHHFPAHTSREDVDDILKRKRKVREHKACYPCRTRKVRCDSQVPCKTCIDRNHAELCTFNPPHKRRDSGSTHNPESTQNATVSIRKDDWDRVCGKLQDMESCLAELKEDLRNINSTGMDDNVSEARYSPAPSIGRDKTPPNGPHYGPRYVKAMELTEQSELTGEGIYLGGGSVPALVNALRKGDGLRPKVQEIFGQSMLPLFGLDNESATYPFVSLFGNQPAPARISELRKVLPEDGECLENFRQYRELSYVTYPAIPDIEDFEAQLVDFLARRRMNQSNDEPEQSDIEHMDSMSLRWVALLFATFASGVQLSSLPKNERDLLSQVYVCCSFECLRIVNYLSNASLEVIQTLLVLGCVLSNAMNAGAAWTLLGMTIRLAQSLGLQTASDKQAPTCTKSDLQRSRTWWSVLWQDSLLSISYDRATSAATVDCPFPTSEGQAGKFTFSDCMQRICKVGLDTVRNRVRPQSIESRLSRCVDLRAEIEDTQKQAAEHLRKIELCRNAQQKTEHWTMHLHASYMLSELCRPAISPSISVFDKDKKLRAQCIIHLMNTVEAFIGLASVSPTHTRSWPISHRALSSALLLGILGESTRNSRAQEILAKLSSLVREIAAITDGGQLSAPVQRSLSALHKLSAPESRTPRVMEDSNSVAVQQQQYSQPPGQQLLKQQQLDQQMQPVIKTEASPPTASALNGTLAPPHSLSAFNAVAPAPSNVVNGMGSTDMDGIPTSNNVNGMTSVTDASDMTDNEPFPSLDFSDSSYFLPSPLSGFEDESSPYALMDSIMWGGGRA